MSSMLQIDWKKLRNFHRSMLELPKGLHLTVLILAGLFLASPLTAQQKIAGVNYGPFRDGQNPDAGIFPTPQQLRDDVPVLKDIADAIRTYSTTNGLENIVRFAEEHGLKVAPGAWLSDNATTNALETGNLITLAQQHNNVLFAVVGSEAILRFVKGFPQGLSKDAVIAQIKQVKANVSVPVTTGEPWHIWRDNPDLVDAVDLIFLNIHPYWEMQHIDNAVSFVFEKYTEVQNKYPGKRIIIGETGWPSNGNPNGPAQPSLANQKRFINEFLELVRKEKIHFFYFEAFDEKWKVGEPNGVGPHWGFYFSDRRPKHSIITLKRPGIVFERSSDSSGPLLTGGVEASGLARGPAFQLFNTSGALQTTQFALNPDFRNDLSFVLGNFDADAADEVLVGGRETSGLARGPAYQLFEANGTLNFTRFVLNPDFINVSFSSLNVGSNGVLVCGRETAGLARGPAYQAFDSGGNLVRTQFVLNPDFSADHSCMGTNLDGVAGDEVIVGGREVSGLARGPAFQGFSSAGSLLFTRFVLNPNFTETKLIVTDVGGSKNIVVYGRETSGVQRGPAYQMFDASGNFILTRFVLNPNFTEFQVFGANTTNTVNGEEIVTGGIETSGLARGPAVQVWDKSGNHLFTRFVLNPDFTEVKFTKIDINSDGLDEIMVVGRETKRLTRGPAFQLFDGSGNLLVTQFVLNGDFTNLRVFTMDQNGDGDKEVGIGGVEISGLKRGPAYQIFESNGNLLQTQFVLNPDF